MELAGYAAMTLVESLAVLPIVACFLLLFSLNFSPFPFLFPSFSSPFPLFFFLVDKQDFPVGLSKKRRSNCLPVVMTLVDSKVPLYSVAGSGSKFLGGEGEGEQAIILGRSKKKKLREARKNISEKV